MITRTYSIEELEAMRITKRDLADKILLSKWEEEGRCAFDYALPQQWLDKFTDLAKIDYHLVLSTTFWVYQEGSVFGYPVSGCKEVNQKLRAWRYNND
jgi:hypothetical protein